MRFNTIKLICGFHHCNRSENLILLQQTTSSAIFCPMRLQCLLGVYECFRQLELATRDQDCMNLSTVLLLILLDNEFPTPKKISSLDFISLFFGKLILALWGFLLWFHHLKPSHRTKHLKGID
ncbi:hypothetical protein C5167_006712 [Papaver somniferum]|uniref:Uncharacterized protein n=1 Tax=Papaver somniferum TaxID=3469 RepID=A0A4Y7JF07_PAPSO|nr:hypothetical protein C5167_006712 [Papaver somniferum]